MISEQFTNRFPRILELLENELTVVEGLFNRGVTGQLLNMPPLAGAIKYMTMLKQRIDSPIQSLQAMQHP